MFGDSQMKYSITIQVEQPEKKSIVFIFLIKNEKGQKKQTFWAQFQCCALRVFLRRITFNCPTAFKIILNYIVYIPDWTAMYANMLKQMFFAFVLCANTFFVSVPRGDFFSN